LSELWIIGGAAIAGLLLGGRVHAQVTETSPALRQVAVIALPNVSGRIDHLAFDAARNHLFVAVLGNETVEVVDTAKGAHLTPIRGRAEGDRRCV
jgi:hypothetical protein